MPAGVVNWYRGRLSGTSVLRVITSCVQMSNTVYVNDLLVLIWPSGSFKSDTTITALYERAPGSPTHSESAKDADKVSHF